MHREFDFQKIFNDFLVKLQNYNTKETSFDSNEDNILIAILTFMTKIIVADDLIVKEMPEEKKKNLVMFLFKKCLFNVTQENIDLNNVICKKGKSRVAAMDLILALTKGDVKLIILVFMKGFGVLAKYLPTVQNNRLSLDSMGRNNNNGYIGIRNPGCICYMNAML